MASCHFWNIGYFVLIIKDNQTAPILHGAVPFQASAAPSKERNQHAGEVECTWLPVGLDEHCQGMQRERVNFLPNRGSVICSFRCEGDFSSD